MSVSVQPESRPDGLSIACRMRQRPGTDGPASGHRSGGRSSSRSRRRFSGASTRRVARRCCSARVKGTAFPLVSNLFGTIDRARFLFRDTLDAVRRLVELKVDPGVAAQGPGVTGACPRTLWRLLPQNHPARADPRAPDDDRSACRAIQSWPTDGGPFITLPQVYTEDPDQPGLARSNLGMYRVQLSGNQYDPEPGSWPALPDPPGHRRPSCGGYPPGRAAASERVRRRAPCPDLGGGHAACPRACPSWRSQGRWGPAGRDGRGRRWPANARRGRLRDRGHDRPDTRKPEGPFGDHLGYYSLTHDFPVLRVETVYHRQGAIWPFTSVGRPPQEDTTFGALIHELTGPIIPTVIAGRSRRSRRRCRGRAPAAAGDRQRAIRSLFDGAPAAGDPHRSPTPSSARGSFRWRSIC